MFFIAIEMIIISIIYYKINEVYVTRNIQDKPYDCDIILNTLYNIPNKIISILSNTFNYMFNVHNELDCTHTTSVYDVSDCTLTRSVHHYNINYFDDIEINKDLIDGMTIGRVVYKRGINSVSLDDLHYKEHLQYFLDTNKIFEYAYTDSDYNERRILLYTKDQLQELKIPYIKNAYIKIQYLHELDDNEISEVNISPFHTLKYRSEIIKKVCKLDIDGDIFNRFNEFNEVLKEFHMKYDKKNIYICITNEICMLDNLCNKYNNLISTFILRDVINNDIYLYDLLSTNEIVNFSIILEQETKNSISYSRYK